MTPPIPGSNPQFPQGTREFKSRGGAWIPYIFGGCFGGIGLIALIIGIVGLSAGAGTELAIPAAIGALFVLIGIGILVGSYFFGKTYTISCRPDGFTVKTENKRKGVEQREYRWEDITSTQYHEFRARRSRSSRRAGGTSTIKTFAVETTQGQAFKVGPEIGDFPGLIALLNAMTPHLPYTWQPQTGFAVSFGPLTAGRSAYVQTPRTGPPPPPPAGAPTQPGPPPLPPQ